MSPSFPVIFGCISGEIYRKTSSLNYLILRVEFTDTIIFHTYIIYYGNYYDMCLEYINIKKKNSGI